MPNVSTAFLHCVAESAVASSASCDGHDHFQAGKKGHLLFCIVLNRAIICV